MIPKQDISNSLGRLQSAFEGRYGNYPLLEGRAVVGMLTCDNSNRTIYITYRGSVNSFSELISCLCFWKTEWPEPHNGVFPFKGRAHASLVNSFQKIKKGLEKDLKDLSQISNTSLNDWKFVVEGYSRGSALATLTALFLKQNFSQTSIQVFTYSTMKIFDKEGAENYEKILGDQHLSFVCKQDPFPRYLGPTLFGFYLAPKKPVAFSAIGYSNYEERVTNKSYSYLHPYVRCFSQVPIIGWIFQKIIPPKSWEAHMPQTYNIIVPLLLQIINPNSHLIGDLVEDAAFLI